MSPRIYIHTIYVDQNRGIYLQYFTMLFVVDLRHTKKNSDKLKLPFTVRGVAALNAPCISSIDIRVLASIRFWPNTICYHDPLEFILCNLFGLRVYKLKILFVICPF